MGMLVNIFYSFHNDIRLLHYFFLNLMCSTLGTSKFFQLANEEFSRSDVFFVLNWYALLSFMGGTESLLMRRQS